MKKVILSIAALVCAMTMSAEGVDPTMNPLITAMPSLSIAPDARAAGQGDVGVATEADFNAQYWNPAKYAYMYSKGGITANYTPWLRKLVGDIDLELNVAVIDDHVLIGIQGINVNGQIHGIDHRASDGHRACSGDGAAPVVVIGRQVGAFGTGILWGEVEGHHFGATSRNLGLYDRGVLAVLVELLVADI